MRILFRILGVMIFATWIGVAALGLRMQHMFRSVDAETHLTAQEAFKPSIDAHSRPRWGAHPDPETFAQGGSSRPGRPMMRATPTR